jgi:hypothetical protein
MMNMGKGTRIIESFSNWLSGYDINENIAAAKVYMQKRYANRLKKDVRELTPVEKDKALENSAYLKILDLLKGQPGYVMPFTKFHFDQGITIDELNGLLDTIKTGRHLIQQLSKPIEQWANTEPVNGISGFEQLNDELRTIEREKGVKWFINGLPKNLRDQYRALDKDKQQTVITLAVQLDELGKSVIDRLFEKIKSMDRWKIEDVITYTSNYINGFSNLEMKKKIDELESLEPEAGILYNDDKYLVMSIRTKSAQEKLCAVANWCINRGQFYRYADKGLQINIFNFGTDPDDPLFLTGNTIGFDGRVMDSHDINDKSIRKGWEISAHFKELGYPDSLISAIKDNFENECNIKRALSKIYNPKEGKPLTSRDVVESLIVMNRGVLAGTLSNTAWGKIAGSVSRIAANESNLSNKLFIKCFIDSGILTEAAWNIFDSVIGKDYTREDMEAIKDSTIFHMDNFIYILDKVGAGIVSYDTSTIERMKSIIANRAFIEKEIAKRI